MGEAILFVGGRVVGLARRLALEPQLRLHEMVDVLVFVVRWWRCLGTLLAEAVIGRECGKADWDVLGGFLEDPSDALTLGHENRLAGLDDQRRRVRGLDGDRALENESVLVEGWSLPLLGPASLCLYVSEADVATRVARGTAEELVDAYILRLHHGGRLFDEARHYVNAMCSVAIPRQRGERSSVVRSL